MKAIDLLSMLCEAGSTMSDYQVINFDNTDKGESFELFFGCNYEQGEKAYWNHDNQMHIQNKTCISYFVAYESQLQQDWWLNEKLERPNIKLWNGEEYINLWALE